MGGIAGVASISPKTWGLLLFAFEVYLLFRAFSLGRGGALWLLVPTFLLWANIDQSFLTGLVVMAAASVGYGLDGKKTAAFTAVPAKPERLAGDDVGERGFRIKSAAPPQPRSLSSGRYRPVGLFGQSVYVPRLRRCVISLRSALRAGEENHDRRNAFLLRSVDPPERRS